MDSFGRSSTVRGPTIFQSPFLTGWLLPTDVTRQIGSGSYGSSVEAVMSTGTILVCGADTIAAGVAVTLVITRLAIEFPELVTGPPYAHASGARPGMAGFTDLAGDQRPPPHGRRAVELAIRRKIQPSATRRVTS